MAAKGFAPGGDGGAGVDDSVGVVSVLVVGSDAAEVDEAAFAPDDVEVAADVADVVDDPETLVDCVAEAVDDPKTLVDCVAEAVDVPGTEEAATEEAATVEVAPAVEFVVAAVDTADDVDDVGIRVQGPLPNDALVYPA